MTTTDHPPSRSPHLPADVQTIPCPHCQGPVIVPPLPAPPLPPRGPRLLCSEYLPVNRALWHNRAYLRAEKYLILADLHDVQLTCGLPYCKHYVYLRPAKEHL